MGPAKSGRLYERATKSFWARLPWSRERNGQAQTRATKLLEQSELFDRDWYLTKYDDVAGQGLDPARHYHEFGWREGRDPGPHFSTSAYLRANPDVSRAGLNPLLHFLEFGRAEGRGAFEHRSHSVPVTSPGEAFGAAAACLTYPLPADKPMRWRRTFELVRTSADLLSVSGLPIGYAQGSVKRSIADAFARLAALSGEAADFPEVPSKDRSCALLDAWFVSLDQLRTRWVAPTNGPVLRAYQHDPSQDGRLALVGEGLAATTLDFLDLSLRNPYFPVLFVRSDCDGNLVASSLLEFPSLCRGGTHYPELIRRVCDREGASDSIDVLEVSRQIGGDLLAIICRQALPLIGELAVDLAGADGTHPLFQPNFQIWLSQVARIPMSAMDSGNSGQPHLVAAVDRPSKQPAIRETAGKLTLAADMIPSLSVISAAAGADEKPVEAVLPLIVSDADWSQPASLFEVSSTEARVLRAGTQYYPSTWPSLTSGRGRIAVESVTVAAIRQIQQRELTSSELLVPVRGPGLALDRAPKAITWLIWPEGWTGQDLELALEALSMSVDATSHVVAFAGNPRPLDRSIAERLFGERVGVFADVQQAAESCGTELVGYLGPGIILHDQRTSHFLSTLLDEASVSTASCVILGVEDRGKAPHVGLRDGGEIAGRGDGQIRGIGELEMRRLWRSVYPVVRPPDEFWIARSSDVVRWSAGGDGHPDGTHVCTSFVTVSTASTTTTKPPVELPRAVVSLRSRTLYG